MASQNNKTISAVETTLDILAALEKREPVGLSDLASHLDIPTSTVFIHLNTLVQRDYVVKESGSIAGLSAFWSWGAAFGRD